MTKKDYILIADVLSVADKEASEGLDGYIVLQGIIDRLCLKLERDNPRFDRARFIDHINK